jgi:hypothetical protein
LSVAARLFALPLALALVLGCASAPPTAPAKPETPPPSAAAAPGPSVLALKAPEAFGSYKLTSRKDSGRPTDGIAHNYASPTGESWIATFYKLERADLGADPDQLLDAQLQVFAQILEYQRQQGLYDTFDVVAAQPDAIRDGTNVIRGRKLAFIYRKNGAAFVSVFFLYAIRDGFVKIRGTVDTGTWEGGNVAFPREFMSALIAGNAAA